MELDLQGRTALVTASSSGMGLEIARSLAAGGASVAINGRHQAGVERAIADVQAQFPHADLIPVVTDNGTASGCRKTLSLLPDVDILVNNLGIYESMGFFDESDEAWQKLIEVNVMSGIRLSRQYLRGMLDRGQGRMVFISSESGVAPSPVMAHGNAIRSLVLGIARTLAELTKRTEVTVNSVLPGPTRTKHVERFLQDLFPELPLAEAETRFISENRPASLIGRLIQPKEIGDIVAFLCSARASAINGSCIRAEGGLVRTAF